MMTRAVLIKANRTRHVLEMFCVAPTGSWRTCQTETCRPAPPGRGTGTVPATQIDLMVFVPCAISTRKTNGHNNEGIKL